jgi:NAD(P)H dehydrogenase (quinone)
MILVTGATGHFGKSTIDFLLKKGFPSTNIVALVRDEEKAAELKSKGVTVRFGDYDNHTSLVNAFKGIEKLLFVSGSDITKRPAQHRNVIDAAKEAGVGHIVYTSFQRKNESETSPLWIVAQSHIQTENWLKESGIAYTILKNNLYMDFLPGFIGEKVLETGVIYVPAEGGKVSAVLRVEMAEAAANVLVTSGHQGKEYNFTNTAAVSYHEIAQMIAEISGKKISYVSPSVEDYGTTLAKHGLPAEVIGIFSSFAVAQAKGELDVESIDLEALLGRKPLAVGEFLASVYAPQTQEA